MKKFAVVLFALLFGTSLFASGTGQHEVKAHKEIIENDTATEVTNPDLCEDDLELEEDEEELFEKVGFLTTEDCALKGTFTSCYAESYVCNFEWCYKENEPGTFKPVQIVLFVHDDAKYYKVELSDSVKRYELDEGLGRNEVTIIGQYNEEENVIIASEFKAPPPPKKSFFKGCL
jgi:hypothetical protein